MCRIFVVLVILSICFNLSCGERLIDRPARIAGRGPQSFSEMYKKGKYKIEMTVCYFKIWL